MQASISGEIKWRVDLYARIFELCRQSELSFARFIALVPDRLRLAVGESVERTRIPVSVPRPELERWADLAELDGVPGGRLPPAALRRAIRVAQIDADLDPIGVGAWLETKGEALVDALARVYIKSADEIGKGEGGEEVAYLVHLELVNVLKTLVEFSRAGSALAPAARASLIATTAGLAVRAVAAADRGPGRELSPRLGLQFAVTLSPLALSPPSEDPGRRTLGFYRTTPQALQLARRVIQEPVEVVPLDRVVATIAERIAVDPAGKQALLADALADMVRDCLLLLVVEGKEAFRPIASSSTGLIQHLQNARRREQLARLLASPELAASKPAVACARLLGGAQAVFAGDGRPLGIHGGIEQRAQLAASGAVALVLDQHTHRLQQAVLRLLSRVPDSEATAAYEEGRCYRISGDPLPLYKMPIRQKEAYLYVDADDLSGRAFAVGARSAADFVVRYFHGPVLDLAGAIAGAHGNSIIPLRIDERALVFRGDLVSLVELALRVRRVVEQANLQVGKPAADVLGGRSSAIAEAAAELVEVEGRIRAIEDTLKRLGATDPSARFLRDEYAMLFMRADALRRTRDVLSERASGAELEAGAFLSFGELPEEVSVDHAGVRCGLVRISRAMLEAQVLAARSSRVAIERRRLVGIAATARPGASVELPFRVSVLQDGAGSREIYNAGSALSSAALDAFRADRRGVLVFEDVQLKLIELSDDVRGRFVFERDEERLVIARRAADGLPVYVFRFSGTMTAGSGSSATGVDVWESLLADSSFARAVLRDLEGRLVR